MNQDVKNAWIDALASGDYVQGKRRLCKDDKFCCLGVLTDLYVQSHPDAFWVRENHHGALVLSDETYNTTNLPRVVRDWAGLEQTDPFLVSPNHDPYPHLRSGGEPISALNDRGYTFEELIPLIKEQL